MRNDDSTRLIELMDRVESIAYLLKELAKELLKIEIEIKELKRRQLH